MNNFSPLRYPGGKTKLYTYILNIIEYNNLIGCTYVEPFAGGCGLALKLLINNNVERIIINDFDYAIYACWYSILNNSDEFCRRIETEPVNIEQWQMHKMIYANQHQFSLFDVGFSTFFLNRTNRSGIINGGVIGGIHQESKYSIDCRFNKEILIKKIQTISKYRDRIELFGLDATDFVKNILSTLDNIFVYFDPPYVKKGKELYKNYFDFENHEELKDVIVRYLDSPWIVTYDNHPEIGQLYQEYYQEQIYINYSAGRNKKGDELAIFSNKLHSPART